MCLTVMGKRVRYKIATKDIVVYKMLKKRSGRSPFQEMKYEPNTKYVSVIDNAKCVWKYYDENEWEIEVGLHSFIELRSTNMRIQNFMIRKNSYLFKFKEKLAIFPMIIPKGAKYVVGEDGEVVSSSLFTGDMKPLKRKQFKSMLK